LSGSVEEWRERMMSGDQRRLAAVMFTDIVGYSSLTQKDERLALELLEEHRKIVRPIVARHHGHEVKTIGDAFLIEFESALKATQCAVDIQRGLSGYNQLSMPERSIHLRIGIHLGDVERRQSDVLGDAVNIASRIEPLAEADGICISEQVYDQVRNKINCPIENLGPRQLKNMDYPIDVHRILWEKDETAKLSLDKKRIAVLPFLNISPDPKDEYFAEGLTEELIARLSMISGLRVIARTSVMRYRGASKSVREIGKELESGSVLEGSVRKAADRLRVTAQLIDATTQEHLWVQNYDRQLEDVFAIQTEVAQNVADALRTRLLDEEKEKIEKKPTGDIGAYTFYLKGRYYWNERNRESLQKAMKYFEEAIKRDPGFALAYSGIADTHIVRVDHGYLTRSEGYAKARDAATKALELDDTLAEAHTSLANILSMEWDRRGAEEEFAKALRNNPNYATGHHWYSIHFLNLGRLDEAIKELKVAEELDPLSPMIRSYGGGCVYLLTRQYDIALAELDKALELDPNFYPAHAHRANLYLAKSMFDEALGEIERVLPVLAPSLKPWLGSFYAIVGRIGEAKRILRECEEASAHGRDQDVPLYSEYLAIIHSRLGNKDRAFEWLEKAFRARTTTPFQVKLNPFFDEITSDPRFDELMKKTVGSLSLKQE
jgi:adenylate cyclase